MDGRTQLPVIHWIKEKYDVDFVDIITEAGIDGVIAIQRNIEEIIRSINISLNINKSNRIFIVGHYDCRGNSVDKKTHRKHIQKAVRRLKKIWPRIEIVGLWVGRNWKVEICYE